jgi:hypothetical protein
LQGETAKDQSNAEGSEPPLRQVVRVVFNVRIHRRSNAGDKTGHEPDPECKRPGVVDPMHESATDQCGGRVPDRSGDSSPN